MYRLSEETIERIYAGWLGKVIGIRLGAPVEGWSSRQIQEKYGEVWEYPVDYGNFAADDDSNGPLFLVRALELVPEDRELCARDVAEALLNYAPFEHGFFWWGGYGVSTEHTAYLNLRHGLGAPLSGSIAHNGAVMAEQIGGQIFVDCWGLVSPGNPEQAAGFAKEAASVTHDGNGVYGGIFVAVCISLAFEKYEMQELISQALAYIPADCAYARAVKAVTEFWKNDREKDWRNCLRYVQDNFGYDKYPGSCHIIPNAAVMILALLYGEDDFTKTLCICNMCGWDTDCNVGNLGTIMGVRLGLAGIEYDRWRKPINDLLICSGTMGSLNITDVPWGASYMAGWAFRLAGEKLPGRWEEILADHGESCHFAYPGSTHGMRLRSGGAGGQSGQDAQAGEMCNVPESACLGGRALKIQAERLTEDRSLSVYQKTYYRKEDLYDNRYEPAFSPKIYPGQRLRARVLADAGEGLYVQLYVLDVHDGEVMAGDKVLCPAEQWTDLEFVIPTKKGACLGEAGLLFTAGKERGEEKTVIYLDYLEYGGDPEYAMDFAAEKEERWCEFWSSTQREITQFTRLKGGSWLEGEWLHLFCTDFAETYTGSHRFQDYCLGADIRPVCGEKHFLNVRVQGAMRSYAAGFDEAGSVAFLKNRNGYRVLEKAAFDWKAGEVYHVEIACLGNFFNVWVNGKMVLCHEDKDSPFLTGAVGMSVRDGSHCAYSNLSVRKEEISGQN